MPVPTRGILSLEVLVRNAMVGINDRGLEERVGAMGESRLRGS